ncbi:MAG: ABC transporter permease [Candidatus Asgardarchaeia archaeon]
MKIIKTLLFFFPLFFLITFFYLPVSTVLIDAFISKYGTFTLEYFYFTFSSPLDQKVIAFTFFQAVLSTYFTILIGLPAGYIFGRYRFYGKELLRSLLTVPFVLPSIVVALGFIVLFGDYGIIPQLIRNFLGISIKFDGFTLILLAHAYYNAPIVIQMVSSAMERMDPSLEEAAESLGSSGLHKFIYVILPQIFPALVSAALLTFIFCFMSFTLVITLGGAEYRTIEVQIYTLYKYLFRKGEAAALAVLQLITSLSFSYIYIKSTEKISAAERVSRVERPRMFVLIKQWKDLLNPRSIAVILYLFILTAFFIIPIGSAVFSSFYDRFSNSFSLDGYLTIISPAYNTYLGTSPQRAIFNSLFYAFSTLIVATVLGLISSYTIVRFKIPFKSLYSALVVVPLGVSAITLSLGLVRFYLISDFFYENIWILILAAHILVGFPFTMRAISTMLSRVDSDLIDAGKMLGGSDFDIFRKIDLPIIAPGIAVGAIFAFAMSIGEMAATLFLATPGYITIPVAIYQFIGVRKYLAAGAMSTILIVITFIAFVLIRILGKKEIAGGF